MDSHEVEKEFRAIADAFIDQANQQSQFVAAENVGMAMLYAASRFNAHVVALKAGDLATFRSDIAEASVFFENEYKDMLAENMKDYERVFPEAGPQKYPAPGKG